MRLRMEHLLHWLSEQTSEVEHVLATSCLLKNENFSICLDSRVGNEVSAKDIILYIIGKIVLLALPDVLLNSEEKGLRHYLSRSA